MSANLMPNLHSKVKRNLSKFIRFGVVGSIGTGINFAVYYVMTEIASLGLNVSAIGAFCVAVTSNYILNHQWTFSAENENRPVNFKQFAYYLTGNLVGLLVNLLVLNALVAIVGIQHHLMWQMLGITSGMILNFIFAKKLVFQTAVKTK